MIVVVVLLLYCAQIAVSMPVGAGVPENITLTFLTPTSLRVSWDTSVDHVDKYDVSYKPTDARVVAMVAGNSDAVTLSGLKPDTQYQLFVIAVWNGTRYRSRPIVFRTMELPMTTVTSTLATEPSTNPTPTSNEPFEHVEYPQTSSTVRGVEIGIVLLVMAVWVAAIALFFNRWGKIRMLLPYQPDYKQEQLKVPGTAACAAAVAAGNTCIHQSREKVCSQPPKNHRERINSAIFVSNSGPGFDSKEFFRRHGSISRLCRRAKSVDNLSVDDDDDELHFGLPMLSISGPSPPDRDDTDCETDRFIK
ncbi:uncharacterized protein [Onthophagus taurus]|uniref:uncharacterized protein isoform X2 n=1 Tax=Onthophagus taurus TaxID=166361 RepID=UPI000C20FC0D|nr:uncharacterized protein LOC111427177 isoform X2 [Onthophagus taurus]